MEFLEKYGHLLQVRLLGLSDVYSRAFQEALTIPLPSSSHSVSPLCFSGPLLQQWAYLLSSVSDPSLQLLLKVSSGGLVLSWEPYVPSCDRLRNSHQNRNQLLLSVPFS